MVLCLLAISKALAEIALTPSRVGGLVDPNTGLYALPLVLSWPATTLRWRFQGSNSVQVNFQQETPDSPPTNNSFSFQLDDGPAYTQYIATGTSGAAAIWTQAGLSTGPHDLTIVKLTEAVYGAVELHSIALSANGR